MTPEKVRHVGALYRRFFKDQGIPHAVGDNLSLAPHPRLVSCDAADALRDSLRMHRETLARLDIVAAEYPHERKMLPSDRKAAILPHCGSMLPKIESFIDEGRLDKSYRWLGFIPGAQWGEMTGKAAFAHCYACLSIIDRCTGEGRMPEAFYRLGFVQGALWATGCFSLEELKKHNEMA